MSQNQQKIKEKPGIAKTSLLSPKYQHSDFPGPTQGRPQSTKTTPRAPQDPPETLQENLICFGCLPDLPQGPPGTSRGPPKDSQGLPKTPRWTFKDLPRSSEDPPSPSKYTPSTSQDPPSRPHARGLPKDPRRTTHDLQMNSPSIRSSRMHRAMK